MEILSFMSCSRKRLVGQINEEIICDYIFAHNSNFGGSCRYFLEYGLTQLYLIFLGVMEYNSDISESCSVWGCCMYVVRENYLQRLRGFYHKSELVKVVVGMRRCGKSVFLGQVQDELRAQGIDSSNIISLNFEDMTLRRYKEDANLLHDDLLALIQANDGQSHLFLDEIQEVAGWETCVNSLRTISDTDIYVTGSNSKMLAGEYATYLAGRYIEIQMYPLSFKEFFEYLKLNEYDDDVRDAFSKYQTLGGLPLAVFLAFEGEDYLQYLRDIFSSVVIKDIVERNKVRDVDLLKRIIRYVAANTGKTFSAASISKYFKNEGRSAAAETVMNYMNYCEEAFLFYKVLRHDVPSKKILKINEKYYIADQGLREAEYGDNEESIELILENIVCLELLRRNYVVTVGRIGNQEIDFVAQKSGERIYVQVSYLLSSDDAVEREFGSLLKLDDNHPKYVVTMDDLDFSRKGIIHRNIRDFLLDYEWTH
jgi:predicted AAA+ superfamily ATPase